MRPDRWRNRPGFFCVDGQRRRIDTICRHNHEATQGERTERAMRHERRGLSRHRILVSQVAVLHGTAFHLHGSVTGMELGDQWPERIERNGYDGDPCRRTAGRFVSQAEHGADTAAERVRGLWGVLGNLHCVLPDLFVAAADAYFPRDPRLILFLGKRLITLRPGQSSCAPWSIQIAQTTHPVKKYLLQGQPRSAALQAASKPRRSRVACAFVIVRIFGVSVLPCPVSCARLPGSY